MQAFHLSGDGSSRNWRNKVKILYRCGDTDLMFKQQRYNLRVTSCIKEWQYIDFLSQNLKNPSKSPPLGK
jgi:hypothetical protein